MLKSDPGPAFPIMVILGGLWALSVATFEAPGCTGPKSPQPCDYVAIFKQTLSTGRGYARYMPIEVLEDGSSA